MRRVCLIAVAVLWAGAFACGQEGFELEGDHDGVESDLLGNIDMEHSGGDDSKDAAAVDLQAPHLLQRMDVRLEIRPLNNQLLLSISLYNPFRCYWRGDLFVERETEAGTVETIGRAYKLRIPGGSTWGVSALVPIPHEDSVYIAKAYHRDGDASQVFVNCELSSSEVDCPLAEAEEVVVAEGVSIEVTELEVEREAGTIPCLEEDLPIKTELRLFPQADHIDVQSSWYNTTTRRWRGDLYVDMTAPDQRVSLLHRGLGVVIDAGIGFSRLDVVRRPQAPGRYLFGARALRRDGAAKAAWERPGTTEIVGVCTEQCCELIEPEQERAHLTLTGNSWIHLQSDFFSEFTSVSMTYGGLTFDITDLCEITQTPGDPNWLEVYFDTMNLPVGPRTWVQYTIELHPMPVVPPGSKTYDALLIQTNGPE